MLSLLWCFPDASPVIFLGKKRRKNLLIPRFCLLEPEAAAKKIKEMSVNTVMSGQIVRYL